MAIFRGEMKTIFYAVLLIVFVSLPSPAQDDWRWPDKPKNLQVLNKDWPGSRLSPVMRGFTRALGVRCTYCHVGEEGKPLSTYDFVSDDNPNKDRAREMLRMLGSVNDQLKKIKSSSDKRVNMWCHTCHRGRPRPMTLAEELGEKNRLNGPRAMVAHYGDLKQRFLQKGAYDFSERTLNDFGYELLASGDTTGAISILALNTEQFSDSPNAWDSLGEVSMKSGQMQKAAECYQKVLTLDPNHENAKKMLQAIKDSHKQ